MLCFDNWLYCTGTGFVASVNDRVMIRFSCLKALREASILDETEIVFTFR